MKVKLTVIYFLKELHVQSWSHLATFSHPGHKVHRRGISGAVNENDTSLA